MESSYSPDGPKFAYIANNRRQRDWKRYRGGQTTAIWIANFSDSSILKIPRNNFNDFNPLWVGDKIYFLSDRNGPVTLFVYHTKSKQVIRNAGVDLKSASAGPDAIVYEQFGSPHVYDLKTRREHAAKVTIAGDLAQVRPHFRKFTGNEIRAVGISPTGARAIFVAHGEIFTVHAERAGSAI